MEWEACLQVAIRYCFLSMCVITMSVILNVISCKYPTELSETNMKPKKKVCMLDGRTVKCPGANQNVVKVWRVSIITTMR